MKEKYYIGKNNIYVLLLSLLLLFLQTMKYFQFMAYLFIYLFNLIAWIFFINIKIIFVVFAVWFIDNIVAVFFFRTPPYVLQVMLQCLHIVCIIWLAIKCFGISVVTSNNSTTVFATQAVIILLQLKKIIQVAILRIKNFWQDFFLSH